MVEKLNNQDCHMNYLIGYIDFYCIMLGSLFVKTSIFIFIFVLGSNDIFNKNLHLEQSHSNKLCKHLNQDHLNFDR